MYELGEFNFSLVFFISYDQYCEKLVYFIFCIQTTVYHNAIDTVVVYLVSRFQVNIIY